MLYEAPSTAFIAIASIQFESILINLMKYKQCGNEIPLCATKRALRGGQQLNENGRVVKRWLQS